MKDVNLETIIDTLSWCKTWQLNGFNPILSEPKLLTKPKRAHKSSWSRRGNQKSFTLTIPSNLLKLVKIYLGIIVRQHHIRSETNGIAGRSVRRIKGGTSPTLLQSGLGNEWWADSMECYCNLRKNQDLLSDGKTPSEGDLESHLMACCNQIGWKVVGRFYVAYCEMSKTSWNSLWKAIRRTIQRTSNSFRSNGWISPDFNSRPVQTSTIWQASSSWNIPLDMRESRGEFGKETFWMRILKNWKRWAPPKSMLGDSMHRMC